MSTKSKIKSRCKQLEELLLSKNEKYGDAALEPLNVFSKANSVSSIKARIDDKLKRIQNSGLIDHDEDTLLDLTGYLILLMIAKENESHNIQKRLRQDQPSPHTSRNSTPTYPDREVVYTGI